MSRVDDFKSLAQDITASFDERMAVLASIKKDVHEMTDDVHRMLDDLHRERGEMAAQLRQDLSKTRSNLKKETTHLVNGFKKEHNGAIATWGHLGATMRAKRGGAARKNSQQ